ncbi:MAG: hypothetical protein ABJ004_06265 [Cyclobacteriaceae bacterium]
MKTSLCNNCKKKLPSNLDKCPHCGSEKVEPSLFEKFFLDKIVLAVVILAFLLYSKLREASGELLLSAHSWVLAQLEYLVQGQVGSIVIMGGYVLAIWYIGKLGSKTFIGRYWSMILAILLTPFFGFLLFFLPIKKGPSDRNKG